jgi:hypothetical protein
MRTDMNISIDSESLHGQVVVTLRDPRYVYSDRYEGSDLAGREAEKSWKFPADSDFGFDSGVALALDSLLFWRRSRIDKGWLVEKVG